MARPRHPDNPVTLKDGRAMTRSARIANVRHGLRMRQNRLERSLANFKAHGDEARPRDFERWAKMRAEIAAFEGLLAKLLAGEEPPLSPRTGERTKQVPDVLGGEEPQ